MARASEVSLKNLLGYHCQLTLLSAVSTNKTKKYDFVSKGASTCIPDHWRKDEHSTRTFAWRSQPIIKYYI